MTAHGILTLAAKLVVGERAEVYGDKAVLHGKIAAAWWLYITKLRRDPNAPLSPEDVAHMEALKKICRSQCGEGTADNYVDGAAYEAIAGELNDNKHSA